MNNLTFKAIGHISRTGSIYQTKNGTDVINLSIATNIYKKDKEGNDKSEVNFLNVTFFGAQARSAEKILHKGKGVIIEGHIENNNYEMNGKKIYSNNYIGDGFTAFGKNENAKEQTQEEE